MGITSKSLWLLINILGGIAVIGSYILGFRSRADAFTVLWGGVPERIRVFYTAGMVLAALGYFAFGIYLLVLAPGEISVFGQFGFGMLGLIFLLILLPSVLWMPLTLLAVARASRALAGGGAARPGPGGGRLPGLVPCLVEPASASAWLAAPDRRDG
jgi:hypothetical protein